MYIYLKSAVPAAILLLFFLSGCASLHETSKIIMGTSTKALEEARDHSSLAQTFDIKYPDAYQRVFNFLKNKNICPFLHSQDKHRIVAVNFDGEADTTEVGIFFEEVGADKTKVIITSLSSAHMIKAGEIIFKELNTKGGGS